MVKKSGQKSLKNPKFMTEQKFMPQKQNLFLVVLLEILDAVLIMLCSIQVSNAGI